MANKKINSKSNVSKVKNLFYMPSPDLRYTQDSSRKQPLIGYNKGGSFDPIKNLNNFLAPVPKVRILQNIETWRDCLRESEHPLIPYRYSMQIMYMDTVVETHTRACMEYREYLTMSLKFSICKDNVQNDEWTKYFEAPWFRIFLKNALGAKFYGYTLLSMGDIDENGNFVNIVMVPRTHISPDRLVVSAIPFALSGEPFTQEPYLDTHIWINTPDEHGLAACGYGILYEVSKMAIMIKDILSFNTEYAETFGTPFRQLKSDRNDLENRKAMENALDNMGSLGWLITGKDDELIFHDGGSKAGWKLYGDTIKRLQGDISKIILGHADALDATPGKIGSGQGGEMSPQGIALGYIRQCDSEFLMDLVNTKLIPFMRINGIMVPEDLSFKFVNDAEEQEAIMVRNDENIKIASYIASLAKAGKSVNNKWIEENMQIILDDDIPETTESNNIGNYLKSNDYGNIHLVW